jgi:hypothetical protein
MPLTQDELRHPDNPAHLLDQAILLDYGVVDMTAIHTTPAGCPHKSVGPLKIQKQVFDHQPLTTPAVHDMASSRFMGEPS